MSISQDRISDELRNKMCTLIGFFDQDEIAFYDGNKGTWYGLGRSGFVAKGVTGNQYLYESYYGKIRDGNCPRIDLQNFFPRGGKMFANFQVQFENETYAHVEIQCGVPHSVRNIRNSFNMSLQTRMTVIVEQE